MTELATGTLIEKPVFPDVGLECDPPAEFDTFNACVESV